MVPQAKLYILSCILGLDWYGYAKPGPPRLCSTPTYRLPTTKPSQLMQPSSSLSTGPHINSPSSTISQLSTLPFYAYASLPRSAPLEPWTRGLHYVQRHAITSRKRRKYDTKLLENIRVPPATTLLPLSARRRKGRIEATFSIWAQVLYLNPMLPLQQLPLSQFLTFSTNPVPPACYFTV